MEKYSCSYGGTKENFVILNNKKRKRKIDRIEYGVFCVVQNILQRGTPTRPSEYLKSVLGEQLDDATYLLSSEYCKWNIIKGDEQRVDYPADRFFDDLIPKYLGNYAFVRNLIIPEVDFVEVLEKNTELDGQQVDFYFPQLKTVFEIDGSSHENSLQKKKDCMRDQALNKENIKVMRFKASEIKKETDTLKEWFEIYQKELEKTPIIEEYKKALSVEPSDVRVRYDAIMRLQMLLLSCLKKGTLKLDDNNWNIQVLNSDIHNIDELIQIAYNDIKLWVSAIMQLIKREVRFPEIHINQLVENVTLFLDFSMFQRYTDEIDYQSNCVYIRTDYFAEKNYFEVAFADTLQYEFDVNHEVDDDISFKFLLRNLFGFDAFRDGQLPIIKHVLERNDTIGILPTGTGKSMCYQMAALLQPGVTVVVVPIISLMMDQKRGMDKRGISRSAFISSIDSGEEKEKKLQNFMQGQYQFMWMSPERFQNKAFRETLTEINRSMNFALAVIDEVHCLSEWGHDFRVSYLTLIPTLRTYCPEACLLGLTATASQAVLNDLKAEFENDGSGIKALQSMDRKELNYQKIIVKSDHERDEYLRNLALKHDGTYVDFKGITKNKVGLVFCPTVGGKKTGCRDIQSTIEKAKEFKKRVGAYHGKLTMQSRNEIQNSFMKPEFSGVLVCTKAFGMGIDKENIKYTIHASLPQSIESFYQEAGRAGRDEDKSEPSYCYILYKQEQSINLSELKKIFGRDTTVEERCAISEHLTDDLSTIMFFWNSNKKSVDDEYKNISDVLKMLYAGNTTLPFRDNAEKGKTLEEIQNALYKLSLLGIVESWTVEYLSEASGVIEVDYIGLDEAKIEMSLLKYIRKHDVEFCLDGSVSRYKKYYSLLNEGTKNITQLIKVLLTWGNDNILYNRLQSTYNMMQFCQPSVSDEEFRNRINDYFRYSEKTVVFDGVVQNPLEYKNWFDVIWDKNSVTNEIEGIISKEKAASVLASLSRYLESYGNNTGLNYLCGLLRLRCADYQGTEGEWRFESGIQSIKETLSKEAQSEILALTLDVARNFDMDEKDKISQVLLRHYPEEIKTVFEKIQDRFSLSIELEKWAKKTKKIMEEKIKWNI